MRQSVGRRLRVGGVRRRVLASSGRALVRPRRPRLAAWLLWCRATRLETDRCRVGEESVALLAAHDAGDPLHMAEGP